MKSFMIFQLARYTDLVEALTQVLRRLNSDNLAKSPDDLNRIFSKLCFNFINFITFSMYHGGFPTTVKST